jgi:hypothetical protein
MNSAGGAMNCQVCNTTLGSGLSSRYCPTCQWPAKAIGAISDQSLGQEVLQWVQKKYQETTWRGADVRSGVELPPSKSKRATEKFLDERSSGFSSGLPMTEPPISKMNAGILDEGIIESLRSDLVLLNRKIASTEDQRLRSEDETRKLLQKSQVLEQDIQNVTKAVEGMSSFFGQQNKKNQELADHCYSNQETSEKYDRQIQDLIREQQQQMAEISLLKSLLTSKHVGQGAVGSANVLPNNEPKMIATSLSFAPEELDLLRDYNSNFQEVPNSLRDRAVNVSIDDETFNRLRNGDETNIAFKPDRKGNYLVITRGGYRYLVPNKQRKIITHIYTVTKAVYKCDGYSESYKDFRLIKPALVTEESIDCWKLSQQGVLEFT